MRVSLSTTRGIRQRCKANNLRGIVSAEGRARERGRGRNIEGPRRDWNFPRDTWWGKRIDAKTRKRKEEKEKEQVDH
jgi:hypothetical protein